MGIGTDFTFGALMGFPSLMIEYAIDPYLSLGGAIRIPLLSMVGVSFEPRYYFTPYSSLSTYAGVSISSLYGDMNALLGVIDPDLPRTFAKGASVFGLIGGVQKITQQGQAIYLEGGYQWVRLSLEKKARLLGVRFPSLTVGYRFFF